MRVGRGYAEGFADPEPYSIAGSNLTGTKARLLLMVLLSGAESGTPIAQTVAALAP